MRRKNRQRGRKAHKTALLNKAAKARQERNDLHTCEILEKVIIKSENLQLQSDEKEVLQLQSYQDKSSHFVPKQEVYTSQFGACGLLSSNVDSTQEICMASQIKIENGFHIKVEPDETTQEGYDEELYSDGELSDPLKYMSIKLEPTDESLSPENSYNSIEVVPGSPPVKCENKMGAENILSFNSVSEIKDVYNSNDSVAKNSMKIESIDEIPIISVLEKHQLKDVDPEVSSTMSETNSEPSNSFPNLNSVYHIIKDTDSSLTCKFVKSEVLKDVNYNCENSLRSQETKHLEQKPICVKSEVYDDAYDYESDSTIPLDEDDEQNENTENKEDKDIEEKTAQVKLLYLQHTSLLLGGLENSNNSSVLSTVEEDFTPYEDFTFAQVNEEALMKRLVFREPNEEEIFSPGSDITNEQIDKEACVSGSNVIVTEQSKQEFSASELEPESVVAKNESNKEEIFASEPDPVTRKSDNELSGSKPDLKMVKTELHDTSFPLELETKSISAEREPCEVESSDTKVAVKPPKLPDLIDLTISPVFKADILTKKFSIKVERIDCTEKKINTKSLKENLCLEINNTIKKEPQHTISSGNNMKKTKISKKTKKKKSLKKPKPEINKLNKSNSGIIELKKQKIEQKKPELEIIEPKKLKFETIEPKKPCLERTELKKSKHKITKVKKQKPKIIELEREESEVIGLKESKSEIIELKNFKTELIKQKRQKLRIIEQVKQKSVNDVQAAVPLYVRPKRRKMSFQEKLDEPPSSVWDSELLPDPSVLSTIGINKLKQMNIKKRKKSLGMKLKDSSHKEFAAGMASAKQRLVKNLCLLSAPVQKFSVENSQVKNDTKESVKCKTEKEDEESLNELEQIIDALSTKEEAKILSSPSLEIKKVEDEEKIEIELKAKIEDHFKLSESIPVPVINDALLEEILTTGFINLNGDTQIYIEPVKPKYRVVTAPPPFPKPSVPFNLDYLVARIGSWNVTWLEEQTANLEPPPDIKYYARNPILSYVCYDEYFDVYYPFLMLEIWQFIFESWQRRRYNSENTIVASVISLDIEDDVLILQCKAILDHHTISDFPFEGHLAILHINVHGCENQAQVFGYVTDHRVEQVRHVDNTQEKPSDEYVIVYLLIKTKARTGNPNFEKVILIENLCLFKPYVLEFEALVNLPKNELVCNILRPQEISYLSKQEKPFLPLGSYSAEQQNTILDISQLISSMEPNISFVSGAPGSGKTHALVGLIQQLLCEDGLKHNVKLLVAAQTHGGINDIGCRLVKLQHLFKRSNKRELRLVRVGSFECTHPGLQAHCIDNLIKYNLEKNKEELNDAEIRFLTIESDITKLRNLLIKCRPHSDEICSAQRKVDKLLLERRQLQKKLGYLKAKMNINEEERKASMRLEILENADVILTTIKESRSSALVSAYSGDRPYRFKCCIVDDATQLTELELITLLLYDTQKLVLFGDTQQLIPKVKSIASREYGYQLSYFERCQLYFQKLSDVPPCNFSVLREQFRMHSDISCFSSSYFYGDKVITPPNIDKYHCFPKLHSCVIFDVIDGVQSMDMLNIYNLPEAQFVVKIISELSKFIKCRWNIGVIASCWGQCDVLQKLLTNDLKVKHDIEIGTVDYFQGHEKDVIIISCVQTKQRQGDNFISRVHLFNLAITRAQKLLIVCGSAGLLQEWTHWKMFIKYFVRKKAFFRTKSTSANIMLYLTNSGHNN